MEESRLEKVIIERISFSNLGFVVLLRKEDSQTVFPIFVGSSEAHSIAAAYHNESFPRPLTHDLLANTLRLLDYRVTRIVITDISDNVFFAKIFFERDPDETYQIDSRPSDAIALALRFGAPLYANRSVIETAGMLLPEEDEATENQIDPLKELQDELELAISEERYEDAARIRDELKKINNDN